MPAAELLALTESVREDVAWLRSIDLTQVGEAELKQISARLRRLLIDDRPTLQRLRKAKGLKGEPRILSPTLDSAPGAVFSQNAGATRDGLTVQNVNFYNRAMTPEEIKARYEASTGRPADRESTLSNWLSSPTMTIGGVAVTRRDVVKFVANKLGGVHLDSRRDSAKEPGYVALDEAQASVRISDLDAVYAELAAIAQQLLASPQVEELF